MKILPVEAVFFLADRQTDEHKERSDENNSRFLQFWESIYKTTHGPSQVPYHTEIIFSYSPVHLNTFSETTLAMPEAVKEINSDSLEYRYLTPGLILNVVLQRADASRPTQGVPVTFVQM